MPAARGHQAAVDDGTLLKDRYRLGQRLGSGGMAEVWRATDERLSRPVAVKVVAAELAGDPEWLVRFFSEAQAAARIAHPNVVTVLDFGEHDGRPFLVMELCGGGTLSARLDHPLPLAEALGIAARIADGLGAAHRLGLVHRDVKPANVLFDDAGHPKLADFGIAALSGAERFTRSGAAIGSPHYVSPEQAQGQPVGPPSDVYSLGVVLYEMLTARRPFDADNLAAILTAHVDQEPEPPSTYNGDIGPELDALVLRLLAKDPGERCADGADAARALSAVAAGEPARQDGHEETAPVPAAVPGGFERWTQRGLLAGSLALAALLAFLGVGLLVSGDERPAAEPSPSQARRAEPTGPSPSATPAAAAPGVAPTPETGPSARPERRARPQPAGEQEAAPEPSPAPEQSPEPQPSTGPQPTPAATPAAAPSP